MAGLDNYDINGTDTLEQWQAVDNLPSTIYAICKSFVNSTTQHGHTPQHLCVYLLEMCQFLVSCWLVNMHYMKTIAENMPREKPPKPEELIERLEEKVPINLNNFHHPHHHHHCQHHHSTHSHEVATMKEELDLEAEKTRDKVDRA